ncbi:hypothetical protein [Nocardioides sp. KR10-350]|uniref:hypothetical protein n=1 Tax=Nocardioides cheoyonin TaxID=3156615 RepID=UPI0032B42905
MTAPSRRLLRCRADRAERLRRGGEFYEVPNPDDLTNWEAGIRAEAGISEDQRRIVLGIARLLRRAMVVDGALPGERVWISNEDLSREAES